MYKIRIKRSWLDKKDTFEWVEDENWRVRLFTREEARSYIEERNKGTYYLMYKEYVRPRFTIVLAKGEK